MVSRYAEIADGVVTNVVLCDDSSLASERGWIGPLDALVPQPGPGWSFDGAAWVAPVPSVFLANEAQIAAAVGNHLAQIEAWLQSNPNGAALTAQQTAFLARMLVGLGRLVLGLVGTVGQAT